MLYRVAVKCCATEKRILENPFHILVVEGDIAVRGKITELLEKDTEFNLTRVSNGRAALEAVRNGEVDCVLLGGSLADMDGYEFLAAAHSDGSVPACPVVVLTAEDEENSAAFIRAGAEDTVVLEWISAAGLRRSVSNAITRHSVEGDSLRAQSRLVEDRRFLKRVLDNLYAFVGVMLPDGTLIEANEAPLVAAGLSPEDVIGKKFWDCFWWSYSPEAQQQLKKACRWASRGDLVRYDVPVRVAGEERLWIDFQLAPLFGENGEVTHLIPSGMDISERLKDQEDLRESERKLRAVYDGTQEFIGLIDRNGVVIEANPSALSFSEMKPSDIAGVNFWECGWFKYTEGMGEIVKGAVAMAATGKVMREEVRIRNHKGEWKIFDMWLSPVIGVDGRVELIVPVGRDITDLKRESTARRASERRFSSTFENVAIGMSHVGLDGRWLRFNSKLTEITGYPPDELAALTFIDVTYPEDLEKDIEQLNLLTAGEIETYSMEKRYIRKNGSVVWVNITVSALRDEEGELQYYIASVEDISKRVEALAELDRQKEFVERLTAVMPSVLYVFDLERGRNVWINRQVTEILGYREQEIQEMGEDFMIRLTHPEDLPRMTDFIEKMKAAADGETLQVEYRMLHRDGSWRWFRGNDTPFRRGPDGRAVEMIGTATDITREKFDAEAMQESEQRLSLGVKVAGLALVEIDFMGGTNRFSKEAAALFGLGEEECVLPSDAFHATFHPEDDGKIRDAISACMNPVGDGWSSLEHRVVLDDGQVRWVKVRTQVFFQETDGRTVPARAVLAALDVTAEKRAAEKILNGEERFRQVFEYAGTGITITDHTGRLERANPAFCKLLGYSEKELRKIVPADLVHPEDRDRYRMEIERLLDRESDYFEVENRYLPRNGDVVWVRKFVSWMRGPGGAGHLVALVTDVTDRRRTEQELREVSQRKDEFLAMLGHELRNPLGAIRHAVQLCKDSPGDEDTYEWSHEVIDRQSSQLSTMVDDLLDVARIKRGRIDLRLRTVDVSEVLDRVITTMRTQLAQRGQIFQDETVAAGIWVSADPVRLEQIFGNLLSNAVKYTPEGGTVRLSSRHEGEEVVVTVKDSGVGIRKETLPHLFDLFRQEETTLDRSQGGLGIGLTVVKSLVDLHGGSVRAASEGVGKGSEFTVRLPAVEPDEAGAPQVADSFPQDGDRGRRVLVVDDHEDAADGLARILRRRGHQVEVRYDGAGALSAADGFSPEIFLLDLGLPGMDGYELAQALRKHPEHSGALLVAISGYAQESDRSRSAAAGFDHHFSKPISMDALLEVLDEK